MSGETNIFWLACPYDASILYFPPSYRFSDSDSEYIHSNDTIALELDPTSQIQLYGAAGSIHSIGYTVINKGMQGHFSIRYDKWLNTG